jgi:hypothetical protein
MSYFGAEETQPPDFVIINGFPVRAGSRVRLRPSAQADAFDLLLDGMTARVEAIQQDFENRVYLVVTVDLDPGREQMDEHEKTLPGHRFFFFPQEVEPMEDPARAKEGV